MTESGVASTRGRPVDAVIALAWVGLGFWHVEDGDLVIAAGFVVLGLLHGSTYLWPGSLVDRFLSAPIIRRKKKVSPPDRA